MVSLFSPMSISFFYVNMALISLFAKKVSANQEAPECKLIFFRGKYFPLTRQRPPKASCCGKAGSTLLYQFPILFGSFLRTRERPN